MTRPRTRALAAALTASAAASCAPDTNDRVSIVVAPVVIAARLDPPDAPPGTPFTLQTLYVGPDGARDPSSLAWAVCRQQKPLGDPGPVSPACFAPQSDALVPLTSSSTPAGAPESLGTIPTDACRLFGPDSPPPLPGQPSARPTDPDTTGGFYLPVRALVPGTPDTAPALASERFACDPSGVTQPVFADFRSRYRPNENPALASLVVTDARNALLTADEDGGPPFVVGPGEKLPLRATWASCPANPMCGDAICSPGEDAASCAADCTTPHGCTGAEAYVAVDPTSHQVLARRESISVAFYATAGRYDVERSGRDEGDPAENVDNAWTAPATPGLVHAWVILRDARGGAGWRSYTFLVQ